MERLDTKQLCNDLEITRNTVTLWVKAGLPHTKEGKKSFFNRQQVIDWMTKNKKDGRPGRPKGELPEEIKKAQLRVLLAKAENEEIKLKVGKGELMSKSDVEQGRLLRIQMVKNGLLGLASSLSSQLVGLSAIEIQNRIESEVMRLLEAFSKG